MFNRAYIEITNLCNFHCDFCPGTTRPPMACGCRTSARRRKSCAR